MVIARFTWRYVSVLSALLQVNGLFWVEEGTQLFCVVPRSGTHLLAVVLGHDLDPTTGVSRTMIDDVDPNFYHWKGTTNNPADAAIRDTRAAVFPLHGLNPEDPHSVRHRRSLNALLRDRAL